MKRRPRTQWTRSKRFARECEGERHFPYAGLQIVPSLFERCDAAYVFRTLQDLY